MCQYGSTHLTILKKLDISSRLLFHANGLSSDITCLFKCKRSVFLLYTNALRCSSLWRNIDFIWLNWNIFPILFPYRTFLSPAPIKSSLTIILSTRRNTPTIVMNIIINIFDIHVLNLYLSTKWRIWVFFTALDVDWKYAVAKHSVSVLRYNLHDAQQPRGLDLPCGAETERAQARSLAEFHRQTTTSSTIYRWKLSTCWTL